MTTILQVDTGLAPLDKLIGDLEVSEDRIPELAAKEGGKHARKFVPVRTGFLKSTITEEQIKSGVWMLKAGAAYAGYVEFGTSKMAAQPYMIPGNEMIDWDSIIDMVLNE